MGIQLEINFLSRRFPNFLVKISPDIFKRSRHGEDDNNMKTVTVSEAKQIIASKQLVFVDFYTSWCAPCKDFAERCDREVAPMIEPNPNIAFIKVNVEDDEACKWAESCGMSVVPTTAVFVKGQQTSIDYQNNKGEILEKAPFIRGNLLGIKLLVQKLIAQYI